MIDQSISMVTQVEKAASSTSTSAPPLVNTTHLNDASNNRHTLIQTGQQEVTLPAPTGSEDWFLSEGVKGEGVKPDWFNSDKYKTVDEQAKAYRELSKTIGKHAPETYEIELPESLQQAGFDIDLEDPSLQKFEAFARENGLTNDQFNQALNMHLETLQSMNHVSDEEVAAHKHAEMEKLGADAPKMIEQIKSWAQNNLNEGEQELLKEFADSAEKIMFLRKFINKTTSTTPVVNNQINSAMLNRDYVSQLQKDPRYARDLNFTRQADNIAKQVFNNR